MPNNFLEVKNIARQTLPRLVNNLVFPNLVHRDFSNEFVPGLGTKIQVKKPVKLIAEEFNESQGVKPQGIDEESVEVKLDKLATVDVEFSAIQRATNVDDLNRLFLEPAAVALAEKINNDGLDLYKFIPTAVGKAGTTPTELTDLANVRKQLNKQLVPVAGRVGVWDTEADAAFSTVPAIVNAEKSGSTSALREGSIGRVMGLDNYMSQAVRKHTAGTLKATSGNITVKTQVVKSNEVVLTGTGLTGTLVKGDIITIVGKQYAVTEDTSASGTDIRVNVAPEITANAGVQVEVLKSHTANLAFNPMAFAYVTRPLQAPAGVESYVTSYNGISLRVVRGYDMTKKKEMLSMDVLYGYTAIYPELATRVLG